MVQIELFEVDHWILSQDEAAIQHNLAHSYCHPRSIGSIQRDFGACNDAEAIVPIISKALDYGSMKGDESLRSNISHWYSTEASGNVPIESIVTTPGASLANFLVIFALLKPGDHVIVQYPTYQQLYALPKSLGIDVSLWHSHASDGWRLDLDELKRLIKPNTKMIIINNPQNPTGAAILKPILKEIVNIAKERNITIFSDEVYRPLFHSLSTSDPDYPPSMLSMGYENTIVTSSLSKAYSLAGLRIGWIASHNSKAIDLCVNVRSYALITASQIDEYFASFVLSPPVATRLIESNCALTRRNFNTMSSFIDKNSAVCDWIAPVGAPIGFIRFTKSGSPVDDVELCTQLLEKKGLLLVPGRKCFGDGHNFAGYVRLGFGGDKTSLDAALLTLQAFLDDEYRDVPVF